MTTKNSLMGRLTKRLRERVASPSTKGQTTEPIDRFDIVLWDHEVIGPHEARILLGFSESLGVPNRADVEQFVVANFGGSLRTVMETLRHHVDENLITATVVKIPQVRPESHAETMIRTGKNTFMDQREKIWEIRKTDNGDVFLARIEKEDIDELLKRKEQTSHTASYNRRPRLANLRTAGITDLAVGDRVSFINGGGVQYGKITKVTEDNVTISADGQLFTLPKTSVIQVREESPATKKEHDKFLVDFFTQAYGDEGFAKKLVQSK